MGPKAEVPLAPNRSFFHAESTLGDLPVTFPRENVISVETMSMIFNRLQKNHDRLNPWAQKMGYEAYRLYDWDIPEYPFFVDLYGSHIVVSDKSRGNERDEKHLKELKNSLKEIFEIPEERTHIKERRKKGPDSQYQKLGSKKVLLQVQEGALRFQVNLSDYLDTGLFLDHRPLREWLQQLNQKFGGGARVLNLFCYTGSLSVAAAKAGAWVTSLDLSKTYLDWAQENFRINSLSPENHRFFKQDAMKYLQGAVVDQYDVIILDPPTFSQSEKMSGDLDIQRDHPFLIEQCMRRLKPKGLLYFSTNRTDFKMDSRIFDQFSTIDVTKKSIPPDFVQGDIHQCFEISNL